MKICMLAYTFYETDNRVIRYAETLRKRGNQVDIIALRRKGQNDIDEVDGVRVYRIQGREGKESGKFSYLKRLITFMIRATLFLTKNHLKGRYDLIHVHNVPDFLVFAALIPKVLGAKVILDIHDLVPEFYASKFEAEGDGFPVKILAFIEKMSARFSDHVIISNHIWAEKIIKRSVNERKCSVILNYPDQSIFFRGPRNKQNTKLTLIYPGTLNWHQGVDIAIRAFAKINSEVSEAEFQIYGDGPEKNSLVDLIKSLGMEKRIFLRNLLPMKEIASFIAEADIGVVPKRNDVFGAEAFSTKIFEFMAAGVPVIVSETKIDKYYFNDSVVQFFKPEDERDLAGKMLLLIKNRELSDGLAQNALKFVQDYMWDRRKREYLDLVDQLVNNR